MKILQIIFPRSQSRTNIAEVILSSIRIKPLKKTGIMDFLSEVAIKVERSVVEVRVVFDKLREFDLITYDKSTLSYICSPHPKMEQLDDEWREFTASGKVEVM